MTAALAAFFVLAALAVIGAVSLILQKHPIHSALSLIVVMIALAGLYLLLGAEFVAAVQIIVYVGGIVVLIIFSIFLTQQSGSELPKPERRRKVSAIMAALSGFALAHFLIYHHAFKPSTGAAVDTGVATIGSQLLSTTEHGYVLPFEVVSILLLAAMVGCIVIAIKSKPQPK